MHLTNIEILGYIFSILSAICGFPEAYKSYKTKTTTLNRSFISLWGSGCLFMLVYVLQKTSIDIPLVINLGVNLFFVLIISFYSVRLRSFILILFITGFILYSSIIASYPANFTYVLGWMAGLLFALCGAPELLNSIKLKHSDNVTGVFMWLWLSAEGLGLSYVILKYGLDYPLLINHGLNMLVLVGIIYYKYFPTRVGDMIHDIELESVELIKK